METKLPINPELLVWARNVSGYDISEIALKYRDSKKNDIAKWEDNILKWETGEKSPTLPQLEKLSDIYKRPLSIFFLNKPPIENPPPKDFRIPYDSMSLKLSPESRLAIRTAQRLLRIGREIEAQLQERKIFDFPVISAQDNPEQHAQTARDFLQVPIDFPKHIKTTSDALNFWRQTIEQFGIFTFQFPMPINEVKGFALNEEGGSAIVLNSSDTFGARIFTLFHELCHLFRGENSICNIGDSFKIQYEEGLERFCNQFSSAFLIPSKSLMSMDLNTIDDAKDADNFCDKISKQFKVSRYVALYRLYDNNLISKEIFNNRIVLWISQDKKIKEDKKKEESKGFNLPQALKRLNQRGNRFTSLVLSAENSGVISYSNVSDFMDLKVKHFSELERGLVDKYR